MTIIKPKLFPHLISLIIVYTNTCCSPLQAASEDISVESTIWQLELNNDFFFNKDNKISSGWFLQKHSPLAENWDKLKDVPDFFKTVGKSIPTLTKDGLSYRAGITIGQIVQTPNDLSRSDLITDDVPYAGAFTFQASWYAYNAHEFRGLEITAGVVGPPSLAEHVQKAVHRLINSPEPKGWDHQLSTEPVLNINYMRKKKIWHQGNPANLSFDASISGNAELGNLFTMAGVALEMRFGRNMPGGFVYVPDFIGVNMHYNASLKPINFQAHSFYASLIFNGSFFVHNIFLDGNSFGGSHSVEKKPTVSHIIAGLHYERQEWGIHFSFMESSNDVDTSKVPAAIGNERLGTISLVLRF